MCQAQDPAQLCLDPDGAEKNSELEKSPAIVPQTTIDKPEAKWPSPSPNSKPQIPKSQTKKENGEFSHRAVTYGPPGPQGSDTSPESYPLCQFSDKVKVE